MIYQLSSNRLFLAVSELIGLTSNMSHGQVCGLKPVEAILPLTYGLNYCHGREFPENGTYHITDPETLASLNRTHLSLAHQREQVGLYVYVTVTDLIMLQVLAQSNQKLPPAIRLGKGLRFPQWRLFINQGGRLARHRSAPSMVSTMA